MASFDLDAVDQAYAPGVSAPAVNGLSADLWLHAAYRAGQCPHVKSMDIVELNPCSIAIIKQPDSRPSPCGIF